MNRETTTMRMPHPSRLSALFLGLAMTLAACSGESSSPSSSDQAAKTEASKPGKKAPAPELEAPAPEPPAEVDTDTPKLDPRVEQAVTLANRIAAAPDSADTILDEAGMDRSAFEALLFEIARDPELSKSYAVARDA